MLTRLEFWIQISNQRTNFLKNVSHLVYIEHRVQSVGHYKFSCAQDKNGKGRAMYVNLGSQAHSLKSSSTVLLYTF